MTKTRFLALITALALLLAIPTSVFAQNARPHVFVGTVTLDGVAAADGAAVTAWIDGEQVGATTASAGKYVLQLESAAGFPGSTVSFKVSGADASQTIAWEQGGADEVDLIAATGSGSGSGATGSAGATGPAGPAGMWGAKGDDGADGAAGPPGPAGPKGAPGVAGSNGSNGSNGADGSNGSNGSNGAPGADGSDGGGGLAVIALIVAIVALLAAGGAYMMGRRA